jgi:GH15 family glucan-1,4-alpha-glucosidase
MAVRDRHAARAAARGRRYYVRVAEPDQADAASPCMGFVPIKNRQPDQSTGPAASMVSLDALAFVRLGLRAPDDPRIVTTVKVVDATSENWLAALDDFRNWLIREAA